MHPDQIGGDPLVQVSREGDAQLIMRRLVDAYLARRTVYNAADLIE
jgi:hypothetical protein